MQDFFSRAARLRRPLLIVAMPLVLVACASSVPDDGIARIDAHLAASQVPDRQGEVAEVAGELARDQAVVLALARHPSVQAEYRRLDIAGADVVAAGQAVNPRLSLSWMRPQGGGSADTGIGIAQNIAALLMRPARERMADAQYEQVALGIASSLQQLAVDTEAAWYALVAAEQALAVQTLVARAAALRAALAGRFMAAGNLPAFDLATLRRDAAAARLETLRQQQVRDAARAVLGEYLDAPPQAQWSVPVLLPMPSHHEPSVEAVTEMALTRRLDLQALQLDSTLFADNLALARRYRWLGDLTLGVEHERDGDGTRKTGPTLSFSLPLFHRNQDALLRAAGQQARAQALEQQLQQEIRHRVRAQHQALMLTRQAFRVQQEDWIPALADVVSYRQERVNYMLDGVFDLLADKQAELAARRDQVLMLGDYWQQRTALSRTTGSALPLMSMGVLDTRALAADAAPTHDGHDGSHNNGHNNSHHQHHDHGAHH